MNTYLPELPSFQDIVPPLFPGRRTISNIQDPLKRAQEEARRLGKGQFLPFQAIAEQAPGLTAKVGAPGTQTGTQSGWQTNPNDLAAKYNPGYQQQPQGQQQQTAGSGPMRAGYAQQQQQADPYSSILGAMAYNQLANWGEQAYNWGGQAASELGAYFGGADAASAGGSVVADASTAGAAGWTYGEGGSVISAGSGGSALGSLGVAAADAAAIYGAYDLYQNWGSLKPEQGAMDGALIGIGVAAETGQVWAIPLGAILGIGLSAISSSGKDENEQARDKLKELLQQQGFITEDWGVPLYGGGEYELRDDKEFYMAQEGNALAGAIKPTTDAIAFLLSGGDPRMTEWYSGWLTNAAISNTDNIGGAIDNILFWLQKMGWKPDQVNQILMDIGQGRGVDVSGYIEALNNLTSVDTLPQITTGAYTTQLFYPGDTHVELGANLMGGGFTIPMEPGSTPYAWNMFIPQQLQVGANSPLNMTVGQYKAQ